MQYQQDEEAQAEQRARVGRKWGKRLLIALVVGLTIGAGVGVVGVYTLEPGRPGQPDSLQLLLDSLANAKVATREDTVVPPVATDTVAVADSATLDSTRTVPNLSDIEEGDARLILGELGFDIGQVIFRGSPKAVGTVLSTFPVAGERVKLPATVNLILSDGRGRRDSVATPPPSYR